MIYDSLLLLNTNNIHSSIFNSLYDGVGMNIDEQIEILEAYRDGKPVEYSKGYRWYLVPKNAEFNFQEIEYRIVKTGEERLIEDLTAICRKDVHKHDVLDLLSSVKEGKYRE